MALAALALAGAACAQAPAVPAEPPPAAAPAAAVAATAKPRYSAGDIQQAFSFMDKNRDGKVSREEASGFRGVARNFDKADTNQDNHLSGEEFESAMNQAQSR